MNDITRTIIILIIILFIIFFVWKYRDLFFGERVVKVENCGTLDKQELRDECCAVKYRDQLHIQCVGDWRYTDECEFVCS